MVHPTPKTDETRAIINVHLPQLACVPNLDRLAAGYREKLRLLKPVQNHRRRRCSPPDLPCPVR